MAMVSVVCAAGGGLALLAAGRPWLRLAAPRRPPLPDVALTLTGRDLEPLVPALGVVGLAGVVGLLATRRWGRLAVGAL
ncbi:MAG TPA: Trp biosynthesis-associated membrane protein, partial [Mycobacteriales bacterium]